MDLVHNSSDGTVEDCLRALFKQQTRVKIAVAYITRSGADALLEILSEKKIRPDRVEILYGTDFGITDPFALRSLFEYGLQLRRYSAPKSFHPKIYLLSHGKTQNLLVGSANMTDAGMNDNVEAVAHLRFAARSKMDRQTSKYFRQIRHECRITTRAMIAKYESIRRQAIYRDSTSRRRRRSPVIQNLEARGIEHHCPKTIRFKGRRFVFTGRFDYGTHRECEQAVKAKGGLVSKNVSRYTDYLILGEHGSSMYLFGLFGTKAAKAQEYLDESREFGLRTRPLIVLERRWQKSI